MSSSYSPARRKSAAIAQAQPEFGSQAGASAQAGAPKPTPSSSVNYDSTAIVELAIAGIDYRIDSGKQGTMLSISTRQSGTWDWAFGGEARWDGSSLRARAFERPVLQELSAAFAQALTNLE